MPRTRAGNTMGPHETAPEGWREQKMKADQGEMHQSVRLLGILNGKSGSSFLPKPR